MLGETLICSTACQSVLKTQGQGHKTQKTRKETIIISFKALPPQKQREMFLAALAT